MVSDKDTEIIIVSHECTDETRESLRNLKHDYYKVTYAPPREPVIFKRDFSMCINTGIAYSENEWVIKLDDSTELKEDFFQRARTIITFLFQMTGGCKFVVRPAKLEEWNGHQKWQCYPGLEKVQANVLVLDRDGLGGGMFTTVDQAIYPKKSLEYVNGYDERYDIGHGYDDNDIFQRFISAGYTVYLDRELMTFQRTHEVKQDFVNMLTPLWDFTKLEVVNGKYRAYNSFDLHELHERLIKQKDQYVIKGGS